MSAQILGQYVASANLQVIHFKNPFEKKSRGICLHHTLDFEIWKSISLGSTLPAQTFWGFLRASWGHRGFQQFPKTTQEIPKWFPKGSQEAPKRSPRGSREVPKGSWEASDGPNRAPNASQQLRQRASRSLCNIILAFSFLSLSRLL